MNRDVAAASEQTFCSVSSLWSFTLHSALKTFCDRQVIWQQLNTTGQRPAEVSLGPLGCEPDEFLRKRCYIEAAKDPSEKN